MNEGATAAVARLSARAAEAIPERTLLVAKQCVRDFLGVAIAGADEPVVAKLRAEALAEGGTPVATSLTAGRRFTLRQATLINATAGHALDYDDVALVMHVHPTTVILPPLLALAEARDLGGKALLTAFVRGYEAAGMIGAWLGSGPYDRGFHMTGTLGCIGAAVGAGHLIGLDEEAMARAIGLAATQGAGLKAQFGTMVKPLHAGLAAEAGLRAALWTQAGLTGRADVLENAQGYAATQSALPAGGIAWSGYELDRNSFKFHAACFGVHGVIEAIEQLRHAGGWAPADIAAIRLRVPAKAERMCDIITPHTATEAKFSLRFAAALAIYGCDTADPATFAETALTDPDLDRIRALTSAEFAGPDWPDELTAVEIILKDGRRLAAQRDMAEPKAPAEADALLLHKFRALARSHLDESHADRLAQAIATLDDAPDCHAILS